MIKVHCLPRFTDYIVVQNFGFAIVSLTGMPPCVAVIVDSVCFWMAPHSPLYLDRPAADAKKGLLPADFHLLADRNP